MPPLNDGQALTDITYVDNFVDAIRKSLTAPDDVWNEVYNISNGDSISVKKNKSSITRLRSVINKVLKSMRNGLNRNENSGNSRLIF